MEEILCVVEVDLSPKPLSNLAWAATHFKRLINVIVGYESIQQAVAYNFVR